MSTAADKTTHQLIVAIMVDWLEKEIQDYLPNLNNAYDIETWEHLDQFVGYLKKKHLGGSYV